MSTVRPYLKGFAFVEKEVANSIYSTGFAVLKSKDETILLNKIIFYAFMYSNDLMKQMEKAMPRGSYPSINKDDIENFTINLPSLKEQVKLVSDIEKYEKKMKTEKAKIDSSADKKKEVMKKYL